RVMFLPLKRIEQVNEEAVAGSSSMRERHIEDVVYSSVRQRHRTAAAECSLTLKIRALKSQVSKLRAKVKHLQRQKVSKGKKELTKKELMMKELQHLLPAKVYAFVSTQLQMSQRKCHGYTWTTEDKAFFLSLWHASPKCYRLLCKVFSMPSVCTLQKTCQAVDFKTGFNTNILSTMRKAMETTKPIDKLCAIVTDEMSLKEAVHYNEAADRVEGFEDFGKGQRTPYVANYASGFMSMLFDGIRELRKAGMECLVFICDQAAGNRAMLTRLGVAKEQPFFSVDGIRVFCLWDPPHLIKNIRNNWRRHGFVLDGNEITWDILEDLYAYDSHQEIRLCCRLTKKHVHLPPFASMRVRLATQVLSHSVAVGIKTLTDIKGLTGQHQQNYLAAARFCENFNGLFDCFNSKQLKDSHKLKCAISDASAHFPFFDKCLEWLPRLKLVGANSNKKQIPCVEGWQHNILCLKMRWSDLRQRHQ
ncbi:hypothetical protein M9458_045072, partial [Cirrhinus mrigala]